MRELEYIENTWQILLSTLMCGAKRRLSFWPPESDIFFIHSLDPLMDAWAPSLSCLLVHSGPLVSVGSLPCSVATLCHFFLVSELPPILCWLIPHSPPPQCLAFAPSAKPVRTVLTRDIFGRSWFSLAYPCLHIPQLPAVWY